MRDNQIERNARLRRSVLAPAQSTRVEGAILAYLAEVIDPEWTDMSRRSPGGRAAERLQRLMTDVASLELPDQRLQDARDHMLSLLGHAQQYRETRLLRMTQGGPGMLWVLLISFGTVLIGFLLCFGIKYVWSQVVSRESSRRRSRSCWSWCVCSTSHRGRLTPTVR